MNDSSTWKTFLNWKFDHHTVISLQQTEVAVNHELIYIQNSLWHRWMMLAWKVKNRQWPMKAKCHSSIGQLLIMKVLGECKYFLTWVSVEREPKSVSISAMWQSTYGILMLGSICQLTLEGSFWTDSIGQYLANICLKYTWSCIFDLSPVNVFCKMLQKL